MTGIGWTESIRWLAVIGAMLTAQQAEDGKWKLVQPPSTTVKFEMPTDPAIRRRVFPATEETPEIVVDLYNSGSADGKISVVMSYYDLPTDPGNDALRQRMLGQAAQRTLVQMRGTPLLNEGQRFKGRFLSRSLIYLRIQNQRVYRIHTRLILIDNRLYNLSVVALQDDFDQKLAERFFGSFEQVSDDYDLPPRPRRFR